MFEFRRSFADLPSSVLRIGTLELMLWRRVADFTTIVGEIESQIFAGVGSLITVAKRAIKRIIGFWFIVRFLFSILALIGRRGWLLLCQGLARLFGLESWCARFGFRRNGLLHGLAGLLGFESLRASLRLWRDGLPYLAANLALDDVAFDRRLESARTRSRRDESCAASAIRSLALAGPFCELSPVRDPR